MSPQKSQNYANHRRYAPGYHFVTLPLVIGYTAWSILRVMDNPVEDTWYALVGALALLGVYTFTRVFPLKVQDRVIRLEERLRLARLLPADMQPKIDTIRASHLIAMRFASDEEVPGLVQQVLANPGMSANDVKKQVRNWRGDWFRI
jgi:hypothetical protein